MGNSIAQRPQRESQSTGKVILWDGSVHEFDKPVTAAELMLEHPQQAVVEFQPAVAGKRPTPLPADKKLETRRVYLMLPMKRARKVMALSPDEIRRVLLIANSALMSRKSAKFLPFFARICPAVSVASPKKEYCWSTETTTSTSLEEEEKKKYFSQESLELEEGSSLGDRPEYLSRQLSGRGWKPSLDTIEEKMFKVEKRVSHWLF
ncbi:hypothetical protein L484_009761 [Morus notabilis]|uniref:Uncharacterized protein n=1 Tax=Morus notabilis TaxID=981085 RepID=W9QJW5_9ROSA|nr:uncharacterized protein LOC21393080 [Morus notabilis]EXB28602.1 hypothetical protein L484_009761 [Morus notabilis]